MTAAIAPASVGADELAHWLRLTQTAGVGSETARRLLAAFGMPGDIFQTDFSALTTVVSARVARALLTLPDAAERAKIACAQAWAAEAGNAILTLADSAYPSSLLDIPDPPPILYVKGRIALLESPALAVVGSRNATAQGIANAEQFSAALSEAGLTIVSGLALGIDTAAHQGALRAGGMAGSTIAVIGTGADIVYPARNRALAHHIAEDGCIVSEYPLGMPAIAANFPRRNRIISGLARGVLVIEAAAQSGSLITARLAAEQGRDVFAIPGSIHSPLAKGCHQLIKQGAKLVESAQDVLEEFSAFDARPIMPLEAANAATASHPLLHAMGYDPVPAEALATRAGLDAASLAAQLLTLELDGLIERLPGEIYRRLH
ncbi:MAG: DNA-protecting protein DprA [Proteobacteria bacterium]|nr:DNA-protecting protein DprA [Pseudomonadota bacterium]